MSSDHVKSMGYLAIIEDLRSNITRGTFMPGNKLPSEKELCSHFGASRSSVREALAALCYAGIIDARQGSGYYVVGNPSSLSSVGHFCPIKLVIRLEKTWGIPAVKRLLTVGVDGIIISLDEQGQWVKQIRAIRQAANDLRQQVPVLIEIPNLMKLYDFLPSIAKSNIEAIIIHSKNDPEVILAARKALEEEGRRTLILTWLESLEGSEVLLRTSDGLILSDTLLSSKVNECFSILARQGINLDKLMFLAKRAALSDSLEYSADQVVKTKDYDGFIIETDHLNLDNIVQYISDIKAVFNATNHQAEHVTNLSHKKLASPLATALCATAMQAVHSANAAALVVPTETGYTPRLLSKFRPSIPIIAVTPNSYTARQLKLSWGISPLVAQRTYHLDAALDRAIRASVQVEVIHDGDIVIGVTSSSDISPASNSVTLCVVGDVILRAQGIGSCIITGRTKIVKSLYNMKQNVTGKIVVISSTDETHISMIEQCAALIVEEGGLSSHAAIACLALGKPVIVGATDATNLLLDDEQVTLDVSRGIVYKGWVNLC